MTMLERLRRGELAGAARLQLSADLTEFPQEIFSLADSLEVLDLSRNRLSSLPDDLSRLHKLRILFCSENDFVEIPAALGQCPQLEMVGFKANRIRQLPAAALPRRLRWLILTDNRLQQLPEEIGRCQRLQKLMLAGNDLHALPQTLAECQQLELLRIAANRLSRLPDWLLEMPRLSWLACAGNPFSDAFETQVLARHPLPPIPREQIELGEVLGQGASGIIHRAVWRPEQQPARTMAAKLFKGQLTSDGLPRSEMAACIAAGTHPNLIGITGPLKDVANAPPGLLMELIDPAFRVLAGPPSFDSCTRDCYVDGQRFTAEEVLRITGGVAEAISHLHARGILHGDLYAHNLLVDTTGKALLSDFGAASFHDPQSPEGRMLQRLEARAFGYLIEELLQRCDQRETDPRLTRLAELARQCLMSPSQRPRFDWLADELRWLSGRSSF